MGVPQIYPFPPSMREVIGSGYTVDPASLGFKVGASPAALADALIKAIRRAMAFDGIVKVSTGNYICGALPALPTEGILRIDFEPGCRFFAPGLGDTAASDITLMSPTTSTYLTGEVTFVGYRRVFNFDGIEADATIKASGHTYYRCGRSYDYAGTGRIDFNPAFGCRIATAPIVKKILISDFRFDVDEDDNACDFGIVWRSGYNEARLIQIGSDGVGRMVAMMGDNSTWFNCKNLIVDGLVSLNVYQRTVPTAEYELHSILAYGRRIIFNNISADTCYDQHATIHDAEAVYAKCMIGLFTNIHVRDGATGDAYISIKGIVATPAQMDDPDAVVVDTNVIQAFVQIANVTVQASPAFVTAHGTTSGLYSSAGRIEAKLFQVIGDFDRAVNFNGYAQVSLGSIRGNCSYGVLITASALDLEGPTVSLTTVEGSVGSAAFEYRIATTSGTVTIPSVEFVNCRARLKEGATSPAGAFNVRVEKSAGQNRIDCIRFPGCSVNSSKTTNNPAAFAASTSDGAGANEGQIGTFELSDSSIFGAGYISRFTGTAGKIENFFMNGGTVHALTLATHSNLTVATKVRIAAVRCPTTNYETEKRGTATILNGTSSIVFIPSWNVSRQAPYLPTATHHVVLTEPSNLQGAARLVVSAINSTTGEITVQAQDAAGALVNVTAAVTFGYHVVNRHYD